MPIGLRRKLAVILATAGLPLAGAAVALASLPARHTRTTFSARHAKHARSGHRHAHHHVHRHRIGPGAPPSASSEGSSSTPTELIPSGPGTVAAGKSSEVGGGSSGGGAGGSKGSGGGSGGSSSNGDPFAGRTFYVEPHSNAQRTEEEWAAQGRAAEAAEMAKIASHANAEWFGDWSYGHGGTQGDVNWWVGRAAAANALPVLVAYDLPWRDCSGYSGGGAPSASAYREFIDGMAAGIGSHEAVVILEPDALAELSCLGSEQQRAYYGLLSYAVSTLGSHTGVAVYLDAGHAGWQPAATIADRLRQAGVAGARGFSLNVSNFDATGAEVAYGEAIAHDVGAPAPHFIVDTSRNGRGAAPGGAWCNPPGRGLGTPPTSDTGNASVDAYLWVKHPGASDGTCNGGPSAGQWWASYALELAANASF